MTAVLNEPWIESPVEEISCTLPFWTWVRNVGLYGIRTRGFGFSACEEIQKFSASSATISSAIVHRAFGRFGVEGRFSPPRPSGLGVTFHLGGLVLPAGRGAGPRWSRAS